MAADPLVPGQSLGVRKVVVIALGCGAFLFGVVKLADAAQAVDTTGGSIRIGAWAVAAAPLIVIGAGVAGLLRR